MLNIILVVVIFMINTIKGNSATITCWKLLCQLPLSPQGRAQGGVGGSGTGGGGRGGGGGGGGGSPGPESIYTHTFVSEVVAIFLHVPMYVVFSALYCLFMCVCLCCNYMSVYIYIYVCV